MRYHLCHYWSAISYFKTFHFQTHWFTMPGNYSDLIHWPPSYWLWSSSWLSPLIAGCSWSPPCCRSLIDSRVSFVCLLGRDLSSLQSSLLDLLVLLVHYNNAKHNCCLARFYLWHLKYCNVLVWIFEKCFSSKSYFDYRTALRIWDLLDLNWSSVELPLTIS